MKFLKYFLLFLVFTFTIYAQYTDFGNTRLYHNGKIKHIIGNDPGGEYNSYSIISNYETPLFSVVRYGGMFKLFERLEEPINSYMSPLTVYGLYKQQTNSDNLGEYSGAPSAINARVDFYGNNKHQNDLQLINYKAETYSAGSFNIGTYYGVRLFHQILGAGNINNGYAFWSDTPWGTSTGKYGNWYTFYSKIHDLSFISGIAYHFYGEGNVPSWFGGNLNAEGYNYANDTDAGDAYKIALLGAHSLVVGLEVTFKAGHANTDGATLQVNSLTVKALTKVTVSGINTALITGDIITGQIVKAVYDGTQFQIISKLAQ